MADTDEAHPKLDRYMTADQQSLLALALALVMGSPDGSGTVVLIIDHGRIKYTQPQPSVRSFDEPAKTAIRWLRRTNGTPFE